MIHLAQTEEGVVGTTTRPNEPNRLDRGGVPLEKIQETLMQGAIYCGVPAANTAFKITMDILREEGRLPPSRPLTTPFRVATHHTFSEPQLRVAVQGEGAPVMPSHALGLDLSMWDDFAAQLAGTHAVARYDHRGHGGSAVPAQASSGAVDPPDTTATEAPPMKRRRVCP